MPNRILREGILDSEKIERLSFHAEVFYRRLMSVVDDFGLYDARPTILRTRLFPLRVDRVTEKDIAEWLDQCAAAGLVGLYEVDGRKYLQFLNLGEPRAVKSKFPKPEHLQASASTCAQTQTSVPPYALRLSYSPTHTPTGVASERFEKFFREYPKKKDRAGALVAFEAVGPDDGLLDRIIAAVRVRASADDWKAESGRYVPTAASWLRDRRWEEVKVNGTYKPPPPSRAVVADLLKKGRPVAADVLALYPDLAERKT